MQIPFFSSLRFKIGAGYIVLVAINIAVTAFAIYNFGRLALALNTILTENYKNVIVVENMAHLVERHEQALNEMMKGDVEMGQKDFENARQEFYQTYDRANENRTLPDAGIILDDIQRTYGGYVLVSDSLHTLVSDRAFTRAKAFYGNIVRPISQQLSEDCFLLIEEKQKEMDAVGRQTKSRSDEAIIAVLIAAIVATALSVLTMVQFTKRIIEPAERLAQTVHQIGRGRLDLKIDIETNDEVGELSREFNKMTERLRKFEELNIDKIFTEKKKSETIVEAISDAILVCDPESNILLANHSAERLFKIDEAKVVGTPVSQWVHDERLLRIFGRPDREGVPGEPYLQFRHDGRTIYLRPRVSVIPAPHGGHVGVVLVLQDVTQFKDLDKMKSDFMAAVSHEFRTPLTSINMSVDILSQQLLGPLTDAQRDLLLASKQDCERLTKLVRDLLQLSKLESGKIEHREELVDVRRMVESTLQPLDLPFRQKGVALSCTADDDLPAFLGDEQQLSWVVSNLVNNALRYTNPGGSVAVELRHEADAILLRVRDTGRGIPPEHLAKIFDKFVQVKRSFDTTPGSVGLGLAIAKEVVELYGGRISVESEVDKGSTFTVRLPIRQAQPA